MNVDTLNEGTRNTSQSAVLYSALKSIGDLVQKPIQVGNWFDDPDETGHGPEDETDEYGWMDDLDEAA